MDKRKVVEAYRRGLITLQECGQIIGADRDQLLDLVSIDASRRSPTANAWRMADHGSR